MDNEWGHFIDPEQIQYNKIKKDKITSYNKNSLKEELENDRLCCIYVFYGNIILIILIGGYSYLFL